VARSRHRHDLLATLLTTAGFALTAIALYVGTAVVARAAAAEEADRPPLEAKDVTAGLFPEGPCEQLRAAGFRCMGITPPHRYSFASTPFRAGSAELTPALRKQLDVFAEALHDRKAAARSLLIEGRGDATEGAALVQRRADNARAYLVDHGVDASLLSTGTIAAADTAGTLAESRRIEISRVAASAAH
jgi:outer membrane protein OmpA-like peptidoglycan-associated protein